MTPRERSMSEIGLIALRHGLTRWDILNHSRKRKVVDARRDVVLHFRAKGRSFPEIGRLIDRHHTTVMSLAYGREWKRAAEIAAPDIICPQACK
jgi:Bacterial dnaA protein helix-turn-helix